MSLAGGLRQILGTPRARGRTNRSHLRVADRGEPLAAGQTAYLLCLHLSFGRRFNRDGEGVSAF